MSALDLRLTFGATSAWWQLFKALSELGVQLVATPYAGDAVETPWWRAYPNPCRREAAAFIDMKHMTARLGRRASAPHASRLSAALVARWTRPRWRRHLERMLAAERDVDAVLVLNVPANHFSGLPSRLRARFGVSVAYFDGDMPMSLPAFGGYASGVRGYDGADLGEYDLVITNSESVGAELARLGARRTETLHFAADPALFAPMPAEPDVDVFFYAFGAEQREDAIRHMVSEPSRALAARFVVGGARLDLDLGRAERVGPISISRLRQWTGRSRLNLNVVRRPHAVHRGSSCMRLFELAAMGCCVVSNPIDGIERWLEPGREVVVAPSDAAVAPLYQTLLRDDAGRRAIGDAARRRVLEEHTYRHRAMTLLGYLGRPAAP